MTNQELKSVVSQIKRDICRMVNGAGSGHPGGAIGCADLLALLYFKIMKHDKEFKDADAGGEDLFFLSNGHISAVLYSTLARYGYFPTEELATHRKLNSRLQGHPATHEGLPGIRMASGSLGQGLSVSCGAALSKKLNGDDRTVFTLMGDGEQQEGQVWEAAQFAAHHGIDNLIAFIDHNGIQIDGQTKNVMNNQSLSEKYKAFGWQVFECNGNNLDELEATILKAKEGRGNGKPKMVVMDTVMGDGVDFMMGDHHWHGVAPNDEQLASALSQLEETLGDY